MGGNLTGNLIALEQHVAPSERELGRRRHGAVHAVGLNLQSGKR